MNARTSATAILIVIVLIGPVVAVHDPMKTDPDNILASPDSAHLLGTDSLGRDVLSRFLHGGQRTILISMLGSALAIVPAMGISLLSAATSHRFIPFVIDVLLHAVLGLPGILVALVVLALLGTGPIQVATAVGVGQIAPCMRVFSRALTAIRTRDYISAAIAQGASEWRIASIHLLPNALPEILAYGVTTLSICTINAISLQFMGFGGEPGIPDWGVMLADGRAIFRLMPLSAMFSGLAMGTVIWIIASTSDAIASPRGTR